MALLRGHPVFPRGPVRDPRPPADVRRCAQPLLQRAPRPLAAGLHARWLRVDRCGQQRAVGHIVRASRRRSRGRRGHPHQLRRQPARAVPRRPAQAGILGREPQLGRPQVRRLGRHQRGRQVQERGGALEPARPVHRAASAASGRPDPDLCGPPSQEEGPCQEGEHEEAKAPAKTPHKKAPAKARGRKAPSKASR